MRDWKLKWENPFPILCLLKLSLVLFLVFFLESCSSTKKILGPDPNSQHYVDLTKKYFPDLPRNIQKALFFFANSDKRIDWLALTKSKGENPSLHFYLNSGVYKRIERTGFNKPIKVRNFDISPGDLNRDRAQDLLLIGDTGKGNRALVFFNNKKGYFYRPPNLIIPKINPTMDRGMLIDLDYDGDLDMLFTRKNNEGAKASNSVQFFVNNGKKGFIDRTSLLFPKITHNISGLSIADYDGDQVYDIFFLNPNGKNTLWINNGSGKFKDVSSYSLPGIPGKYAFADWADFDQDGDNDLLVATTNLSKRFSRFKEEYNFFLENDGKGHFTKRSLKLLPRYPSTRVYLLDADGNDTPDIIILSKKGVHLLIGHGSWKFSDETLRRLPENVDFDEMTFGDADGDGRLDIFGVDSKSGVGRLWISSFK
jgi:hypothetical protein